MGNGIEATDWSPNRKIVASALAVLILWALQAIFSGLDIPIGVEGALVVVTGYLMPETKRTG